jgi:carboxylesterase 2
VYHTVNSLLPKGLIVGAIAESGIRDPRDPASTELAESCNNMSTSLALGSKLKKVLNVTTLDELRQVPAKKIIENSGFTHTHTHTHTHTQFINARRLNRKGNYH